MNTLNYKNVRWKWIMKNRKIIFSYINENKKSLLFLIVIFFTGIVLGIIFVNNVNENQKQEIYSYVNSLSENIRISDNVNRTIILKQSIKQNIFLVLLIWILGCSLLGSFLIYVIIFYKGFSIGYTASSIIACLGARTR